VGTAHQPSCRAVWCAERGGRDGGAGGEAPRARRGRDGATLAWPPSGGLADRGGSVPLLPRPCQREPAKAAGGGGVLGNSGPVARTRSSCVVDDPWLARVRGGGTGERLPSAVRVARARALQQFLSYSEPVCYFLIQDE